MKFTSLFLGTLLLTATSYGATYKCVEKEEPLFRYKYAAVIEETEELRSEKFDHLYKVNFTLFQVVNNNQIKLITFKTTSTAMDVEYNIKAMKTYGVEFNMYLDSEDQNWIKVKGMKDFARMDCKYFE